MDARELLDQLDALYRAGDLDDVTYVDRLTAALRATMDLADRWVAEYQRDGEYAWARRSAAAVIRAVITEALS